MPKPNKTYMGPSLFPTNTPSLICTHTPSLPLSPHASSLWLMESWTLHPLLFLYIFSYCPTQLRQLQQVHSETARCLPFHLRQVRDNNDNRQSCRRRPRLGLRVCAKSSSFLFYLHSTWCVCVCVPAVSSKTYS
jgi:hypothetical protein